MIKETNLEGYVKLKGVTRENKLEVVTLHELKGRGQFQVH
jgi:hypothetical protein